MFLGELQADEKIAFLELAALISNIDGNLSVYESSLLKKYKKEMDLEDYKIKGLPIEEIARFFQSERSKKIVLTEIFKLIYADGVFQEQERESFQFLKETFGFSSNDFGDFKDWIGKIMELSNS